MIYGYVRISTFKQNIERQIRNIKEIYPDAIFIKETYTGTKFQGRKELERLVAKVTDKDTIVFDSVSRMSRNAEEGFLLYKELFDKNVNLVFLKEPHINTDTYKNAMKFRLKMTGTVVDSIIKGVNKYLMDLAQEQIKIAFEQSQKEVEDLRQRTREGIATARIHGKQIGAVRGKKLTTKKSIKAKKIIIEKNKNFGGPLNNEETWILCQISKMTFYKYLRELKQENL